MKSSLAKDAEDTSRKKKGLFPVEEMQLCGEGLGGYFPAERSYDRTSTDFNCTHGPSRQTEGAGPRLVPLRPYYVLNK